jgi:FKBP-type peptidyl-prolyl cis-trans isomerase 2
MPRYWSNGSAKTSSVSFARALHAPKPYRRPIRILKSLSLPPVAVRTARLYDPGVQIQTGKRVRIRVHLEAVGGATIEDSVVEYIHGSGKMLPGLESALVGLEQGSNKGGVLPAEQAFGNPALSPHKRMKRAEFPADARLKAGERFAAKGANGLEVVLFIDRMEGDDVDVQLLHPLADKDIKYTVEVLSVTDPQPPPVPAEALPLEDT